jgi:hypothetical protein
MEQTAKLKFCLKTAKTATETFQLIKQAYGENALPRITALPKMTIKFICTLLMYKLLAVITDDTGRKTGHSTSLRRI